MSWNLSRVTPLSTFTNKDKDVFLPFQTCRELLLRAYRPFGYAHKDYVTGDKKLRNEFVTNNPVYVLTLNIDKGYLTKGTEKIYDIISTLKTACSYIMQLSFKCLKAFMSSKDVKKIKRLAEVLSDGPIEPEWIVGKTGGYGQTPVEWMSARERNFIMGYETGNDEVDLKVRMVSRVCKFHLVKDRSYSILTDISKCEEAWSNPGARIELPVFQMDLTKVKKLSEYQLHSTIGWIRNIFLMIFSSLTFNNAFDVESIRHIDKTLGSADDFKHFLIKVSQPFATYTNPKTYIDMDTSGLGGAELQKMLKAGEVFKDITKPSMKCTLSHIYASSYTAEARTLHIVRKFKRSKLV